MHLSLYSRAGCLALSALLGGCVAHTRLSDLPPDQQERVRQMPVTSAAPPASGNAPAPQKVTGVACIREPVSYFRFTQATAEEALKINAFKAGADSVAGVQCGNTRLNMGENCWAAIVCTGDAVKNAAP
jgi:hypothetical protein